jgi:hypothetical protein
MIRSKWLRVDQTLNAYPLKRSILFRLMREGKIKSFLLKPREDAVKGCRLIDRNDLDRYLREEFEKELNRPLAHPTSDANQSNTGKAGRNQKMKGKHEKTGVPVGEPGRTV